MEDFIEDLGRSLLGASSERVSQSSHLSGCLSESIDLFGISSICLGLVQFRRLRLIVFAEELIEEPRLGPHDAVDGLGRGRSDSTDGIRLGRGGLCTIEAGGEILDDGLYLSIKSRRTTFDEGRLGSDAHAIHPSSSVEIVQSVQDDVKAAEELPAKASFLDVGMIRLDADRRIERRGNTSGNETLGFLDVGFVEEELSVEVGQVDGIQVDDLYSCYAHQAEVL